MIFIIIFPPFFRNNTNIFQCLKIDKHLKKVTINSKLIDYEKNKIGLLFGLKEKVHCNYMIYNALFLFLSG